MFSYQKPQKTGVYRTSRSISTFQCRFTIKKIHSLIDVPVLEGLCDESANKEYTDDTNESRIIHWQEKVFSRYEIDYYRIKENCKSEHQKQYYQMLKSDSHVPELLFTYVDGDNYSPDDLDNQSQYQASKEKDRKVQSMYLMADLGREVLLFTITWVPDEGLLIVYPDFNHMSTNPFYHKMQESNLHMYHYALEKCLADDGAIVKRPNEIVLVQCRIPMLQLPFNSKDRFVLPKPVHRHVFVLLEIVSASDFKYDGIHIRYHTVLPAGVQTFNKNDILEGSTHASKQLNNCWHFGHCYEIVLVLPDNKTAQQQSMVVYFEAISIDSWHRERYLGNSHINIPLLPQRNETTLNFVQIVNAGSISDRLEVLLVGNRRKVDLASFYGKCGKSILNRYGNETRASGKLNIRYHIIRQHQPMILNEGFSKIKRKKNNITLNELIASYNTARERLEEFIDLKY